MEQPTRAFDFLHYQLEKYPKANCLNYKKDGAWHSYSTSEVNDIVNQLSLAFLEMGYKSGDKMAVISANRPEWNLVELAMQQIGVTSVPIYPTITTEDYKYIFAHSEVKIAFVGDVDIYGRVQEAIQSVDTIDAVFSFDKIEGCEHWTTVLEKGEGKDTSVLESHRAKITPEDLLTIIYTSGTTGRPKGVMLSHKNMVSNTIAVTKALPLVPGESNALSFLPLCHVYERTGVYLYLYNGIGIYYAESLEKIGDNLKEVNPHFFNTVPRLLEKVYDKIIAKGHDLTGLKKSLFFWAVDLGLKYDPNKSQGFWYDLQLSLANKLIFSKWREALGGNIVAVSCGSAALQTRLKRVFWAADIKILEGYGLTETSPVITASIPTKEDIRINSVGPLLDGVEVKIAEDGEILCKGPNVMMGYYKNPEKTAEVIKDGWFHTGDIGEFFEDRYLRITDRKKEMFKTSGGKYVAPQLLENKFKESFLIEQAMVVGEGQKFPAALVVPFFEALRDWCDENGVEYTSDHDIIKNPKVIAEYERQIKGFNQGFGKWEQVKQIVLMPKVWGIDTGELTPTLKLKRRVILKKYEKEVGGIYAAKAPGK